VTWRRTTLLACLTLAAVACSKGESDALSRASHDSTRAADSAFAAVQARGQNVMGVDQYTSTHVFQDLPDGGRIVLDRNGMSDTADVATIRAHMREIADQFTRGDFTNPGLVHAREVPGTAVMAARAATLSYTATDRPLGAEVRIRSADPEAVKAVHKFLAFQRTDHRAAGHEMHQ
jgi:hypothetical protein